MLFDTLQYWFFFAIVVLLLAAAKPTPGKWLIVIASYVFYAFWDWRFAFLLGGSTLANWLFGLWIDRDDATVRKRAMVVAIVFNLCLLGFFKYFNFFADTLAALLNLSPDSVTLRIVLPVGISFFTFEGIAYAVDVYRRDIPARRNPLDFALFISFFPHLVAGPIIRAHRRCLFQCWHLARQQRSRMDRRARVFDANLFRLFRIYRHRSRLCATAWLPISAQFRAAVPRRQLQ